MNQTIKQLQHISTYASKCVERARNAKTVQQKTSAGLTHQIYMQELDILYLQRVLLTNIKNGNIKL